MFSIPRIWKSSFLVFVEGTCTMVIELVAGRILAPYVGVSLYTWTSIIGVVLAGISLGNYLGGKIADRYGSPLVLALMFFAAGLTSITILPIAGLLTGHDLFLSTNIMVTISLYSFFIFFVPTCMLGMIPPLVIKLTLQDLGETGSVAGTIYAFSSVGSIVGTFITGFYLISWFGTRTIVWTVAAVLLAMGIVAWNPRRRFVRPIASFCLIGIYLFPLLTFRDIWHGDFVKESNYFAIKVVDRKADERDVKALVLDSLVHSYVDPDDPTFLGYGYEKVFARLTDYYVSQHPAPSVFFVGGGGYVLPRYIEALYPDSQIDVSEIDPAVTQVVHDYLEMPRDTIINTYNIDARLFFIQEQPKGTYDLIFGDAFNDLSVPYHLTTLEFNQMVKASLRDGGIYMVNIVDDFRDGKFLPSFIYTLRNDFAHVYLFGTRQGWREANINSHVVVASERPLDMARLTDSVGGRKLLADFMDDDDLTDFLSTRKSVLITDDYAPVDEMIAPLVTARLAR